MPMRFGRSSTVGGDGVTVDDDESMVPFVEQEWFADPAQVGLALLVERDPGPDPGVDEQIVAEAAGVDEALQELDVLIRDRARTISTRQRRRRSARSLAGRRRSLRGIRRPPNCSQSGDQLRFAAEDAQQHLLVIAEQEHRPHAGGGDRSAAARSPGPSSGPRSIRSPTNTSRILPRRPPPQILVDLREQLFEQVEPAVDVADGISAIAVGPPAIDLVERENSSICSLVSRADADSSASRYARDYDWSR